MPSNAPSAGEGPPSPVGIRSYDDLAERLRSLRAWAGLSYRELHRQLLADRKLRGSTDLPSADTVHRCLQPGRTRMDVELVVDLARILLGDIDQAAQWRQAHQAAAGLTDEAAVVSVADSLPADEGAFVGRDEEVARLETFAKASRAESDVTPTPAVVLLEGMAGVGKTRLVTHIAHRLVASGHIGLSLWVDLRGYDAERPPADPAAVLDGFLRRLGLAGGQLAGWDTARRAAKCRQLLRGRRALVVLDNAASADQVRPLLPEDSESLVLITSRNRLADVPAKERVPLEVLPGNDAMGLLRRLAGDGRVDAEPDTAANIAAAVGHLPLAVTVIGSRIAATPDWSLDDHLDRLRERSVHYRLDEGVERALASSFDALPEPSQRLLRLLSLHPGRHVDDYAAAALTGTNLAETRNRLRELTDAYLLRPHSPGRYEFHDLIRLYAAARATDEDPRGSRQAAIDRMLEHYLHTAMVAMDLHSPQDTYLRPRIPDPGHPAPDLRDQQAALSWLDDERANLIATALAAPAYDAQSYPVRLARTLYHYLCDAGHARDEESLHGLASRLADGAERGRALTNLAHTYWRTGRYAEALETFKDAIEIHREQEDRAAEARTLGNCGIVYGLLGRHEESLTHFEQALPVLRATGDRATEAIMTGNVGVAYEGLGRYAEALTQAERFLAITCEIGDQRHQAVALCNIGSAHAYLGEHAEALRRYHEALQLVRQLGMRSYEPVLHNDMASSLRALGQLGDAMDHYQAALSVARETGAVLEQARAHGGLAHCAAGQDEPELARRHWSTARELYRDLARPDTSAPPSELRPPLDWLTPVQATQDAGLPGSNS